MEHCREIKFSIYPYSVPNLRYGPLTLNNKKFLQVVKITQA